MTESAERLELFICPQCRFPKTLNPHPDAGKPDLAAGYLYECIPCLLKTRASWASRAFAAELRIRDLGKAEAALAGVREAREQFKRDLYKCPPLDRSTKAQREGLSVAHRNLLGSLSKLDLPNYGIAAAAVAPGHQQRWQD